MWLQLPRSFLAAAPFLSFPFLPFYFLDPFFCLGTGARTLLRLKSSAAFPSDRFKTRRGCAQKSVTTVLYHASLSQPWTRHDQRSTHENQIRGSVLGMRSRRELRSPTDHPEMREQRTEQLRVLFDHYCVYQFDPLRNWKISTGRFNWSKVSTTVVEFRSLFVKRDELFRDRVDFVYTQRLYTCIFAKRSRKVSTKFNFVGCSFRVFPSNSPNFVNHAHCLQKLNDNKS